jgi:hypothetical protein
MAAPRYATVAAQSATVCSVKRTRTSCFVAEVRPIETTIGRGIHAYAFTFG